MPIVPEAKTQDKVADFDPALTELTTALRRAVRARMRGASQFARVEAKALALSNEAIRRVLREELQQRADAEPAEMEIEGKLFRRHQPGTVQVHSLCGPIAVTRWTYREVGVRNGPTCVPMETAAGLIERATPALAQAIARGHADRHSRALHEDLLSAGRAPPSRSTLERIAVELGQKVKAAVPRIEPALRRLLRQRPKLNVALVQDGAAEMWNLMRPLLRRVGLKKWIERIERYHLEQHLAAALEILEPDAAVRAAIWSRWRASLSNNDRAINRIEAWIETRRRGCSQAVFHKLYPHLMYILPNRMRYASLKPLGIPMGSGVTEGACKSLITARTKRSGQRWQERGIESVLALRSILHSDRWPRFWRSFAKPLNAIA
jgi:hypothetical protein